MTSADIVRELQAATPVAPQTLRLRVRTLETPAAQPARARLRRPFEGRRWVMLALPAAAAVAVVAGAITGAFDNPPSARDAAAPPTVPKQDTTEADAGSATSSLKAAVPEATTALAPVAGAVAPGSARLERYAAQLTLEVADSDAISKASQDAIAAIRDLGGYVVTAQVANGGTGRASLTLRVPHDKAQEAFVRLQGLGKILQQNVQIDDLQESADRLDRAIARQRAQLVAVEARLDRTDLDSVERAQLEARRDVLKSRLAATRRARTATTNEAQTATVQLELQTPDSSQVVPVTGGRFDRSIDRVVEILALEAVIVATSAAVLLPFALLGGAFWLGRRGLRRRLEHDLLGT